MSSPLRTYYAQTDSVMIEILSEILFEIRMPRSFLHASVLWLADSGITKYKGYVFLVNISLANDVLLFPLDFLPFFYFDPVHFYVLQKRMWFKFLVVRTSLF